VTHQALDEDRLSRLYAVPITARRAGALYNAFSYPTKIDPEAIALFVAAHTKPGDTVLDVFAGSGTTGLAVRLCERPTDAMRARAEELGLCVEWGPRSAVLYELSVVGALLAQTMCDPPDPAEFSRAAAQLVSTAKAELGWIYSAAGPNSEPGSLRHAIWTDVVVCDACEAQTPYWDLVVARDPVMLKRTAACPSCGNEISTSDARRATETVVDAVTGEERVQRVRRLAYLYGRSGSRTWQRKPNADDQDRMDRVLALRVPPAVPSARVVWGDLYRSGYHEGIDRIHHFYTHRNLVALGTLWEAIEEQPSSLRDALRLLVLSYNATHATLMTRVVVKKGLRDFAVTGAQTGVLYISSLPVEKNVFDGVYRKIKTLRDAFELVHGCEGSIRVVNQSSTDLDLPDQSVDYVFTDPPFGGFIPYAEVNQVNEAWLGQFTQTRDEAIISRAQGKDVVEYGELMKRVFSETARVLKHDGAATVVFHSSRPEVWSVLSEAFAYSGLVVRRTNLLDKRQVTFKQVVAQGSTRGDAIFLLRRGDSRPQVGDSELPAMIRRLREQFPTAEPQHLYSRYVAQCLEEGRPVLVGASDFYVRLRAAETAAAR